MQIGSCFGPDACEQEVMSWKKGQQPRIELINSFSWGPPIWLGNDLLVVNTGRLS